MAFLIAESFDNGHTGDLLSISGSASINATGGVYNTGCGFIPGNANWGTSFIRVFCRSQSDFTVNEYLNYSFWFKANKGVTTFYNNQYAERSIFAESYKDISWGCGIGFSGAGKINSFQYYTDSYQWFGDSSVLPSVCDNQWHFIEINCRVTTASSGYIYVYQDGKLASFYSGTTERSTLNTNCDGITFSNLRGADVHYWIDDLTVWDQAGTYFIGYPKGPVRVQTLRPVEDLTSFDTTSTEITKYQAINEENSINTSSYITIANNGNVSFAMSNLVSNTSNAYAYMIYAHIRGISGFYANVKLSSKFNNDYLSNNTTVYTSANDFIYGLVESNFELNAPLSVANLNNLIINIEKTI